MNGYNQYGRYAGNMGVFSAGLLIGGLAGAGGMLLFAPQSGEKTRNQIQQKNTEFRNQTSEAVGGALNQARDKANQVTNDVYKKAKELT
jgi:gas vesicle protein